MTAARIEAELKYLAADERPLLHLATTDRLGPASLGPPSTVAELGPIPDTTDLPLPPSGGVPVRTRTGVPSSRFRGRPHARLLVHRRPELEGPRSTSRRGWPLGARNRLLALAGQPL